MPWDRSLDLYLNFGSLPDYPLLRGAADIQPALRPELVAGDKFLLRLWLRDGATALVLDPTDQVLFAGKLKGAAAAAGLLFSVTPFAVVVDGSGTRYEALLDLTPAALTAAIGDEPSIACTCDVEIQNADNSARRSLQFDVKVRRGTYNGEATPAPAEPAYPAPGAIALREPAQGGYRIKTDETGSYFQLKDTAGGFRTIWLQAGVLQIGPEEA